MSSMPDKKMEKKQSKRRKISRSDRRRVEEHRVSRLTFMEEFESDAGISATLKNPKAANTGYIEAVIEPFNCRGCARVYSNIEELRENFMFSHPNLLRLLHVDAKKKVAVYEDWDDTIDHWIKKIKLTYYCLVEGHGTWLQTRFGTNLIKKLLSCILELHRENFCTSETWEGKVFVRGDEPKFGIKIRPISDRDTDICHDYFELSDLLKRIFSNEIVPVETISLIYLLADGKISKDKAYLLKKHCSTLQTKERLDFLVSVVHDLNGLKDTAADNLTTAINKEKVTIHGIPIDDWRTRIPKNTLAEKVLLYRHHRRYTSDTWDLYRYLCNVRKHLRDKKKNAGQSYAKCGNLDATYVDNCITTMFPDSMCQIQEIFLKNSH